MALFDYRDYRDRLAAIEGKPVFFIVGASKSGTTWLQRMLDGHPAIRCKGEGHFTNTLLPILGKAMHAYNRANERRNTAAARLKTQFDCPVFGGEEIAFLVRTAIFMAFAQWGGDDPEVACVGEKTPEHAAAVDQLVALMPEARIVHIIRDGRDVAVSGWFHNQTVAAGEMAEKGLDLPRWVTQCTESWVHRIRHAQAFGAAVPQRYREVRYEALVEDPATELSRLLDFLGVEAGQASVAACIGGGSFEALSGGRRSGEEERGAFFRRGVAGDWRNHFDAASEAAFEAAGGDLARELGYL